MSKRVELGRLRPCATCSVQIPTRHDPNGKLCTACRFWKYVDKNGPLPIDRPELGVCWMWIGCHSSDGYGSFTLPHLGGMVGAHRYAYELEYGVGVLGDLEAMHECDNRSCVRHDHLKPGTHAENIQAMHDRGRGSNIHGENHPKARFVDADIRSIRDRFDTGVATTQQLADEYSVVNGTIWFIVHRYSWKHIT